MTRTGWVLLALAGVALAGLYLWARPAPEPMPAPPAIGSAAPVAAAGPALQAAAATPASPDFAFEIAAGKITGPPALTAREGQQVTLRVRSDVADELHVHGYELTAPLPAGEDVALTFIAARAGRFEIELHHSHRELAALEVQPR